MQKDPVSNQKPAAPRSAKKHDAAIKRNTSLDKRQVLKFLLWAGIFGAAVLISITGGAFVGYQSGVRSQRQTATVSALASVAEQFTLANQDIDAGRLEVASRRLEFVIEQDPAYPGAAEKLAEVLVVLYATATPTQMPPTITPTSTRDMRPVQEMLQNAQTLVSEQKYNDALDQLVALRKEDIAYQTARVDGLMYISLRMLGFDKIWKNGDLNGGIYDLVLASKFGPLDAQSNSARDLARLYLIGSSFWEVDPAQAITYFSQVAAAAPGLLDASGWTASARYRGVLIQYGDKLAANKEWCAAQQQYELALSMGADEALQAKTREVALQCSPPTETPGPTQQTPTETPVTATPLPGGTNSPTSVTQPTASNTLPAQPPTATPIPPTATAVSLPTEVSPPPLETTQPPPGQTPQLPYP